MEVETALNRLASRGRGEIFSALSTRHRRVTLLLLHRDGVKRESDLLVRESTEDDVERDLIANHLPELEKAGFIEWDRETSADRQPDVIQLRHAVPTPVVRAMTQPMDYPGTGRSHVWLSSRDWRVKELQPPV
ncbi:hypothetical protein BRC73_03030 [Halobacteriales archaeon QH_7_66_37]|nr:MAG: hypothetical protein BRC73_03030 [Halobacteriales archaeon QH_7_66_37]